jgi:hypothetical protein
VRVPLQDRGATAREPLDRERSAADRVGVEVLAVMLDRFARHNRQHWRRQRVQHQRSALRELDREATRVELRDPGDLELVVVDTALSAPGGLLAERVHAFDRALEQRVAEYIDVCIREALERVDDIVARQWTALASGKARVIVEANVVAQFEAVRQPVRAELRHLAQQVRPQCIGPLQVIVVEQRVVDVHDQLDRPHVELLVRVETLERLLPIVVKHLLARAGRRAFDLLAAAARNHDRDGDQQRGRTACSFQAPSVHDHSWEVNQTLSRGSIASRSPSPARL